MHQGKTHPPLLSLNPSLVGWVFLLMGVVVAVLLRFWQLDEAPPGLYRDEAFNGLDALRVLAGDHALFFLANNGREPAYIYLTAMAISLFGQTALAVRVGAALVGTLTIWAAYFLAKSWFGQRVGVLVAWQWAITLWAVHQSRLGLRAILLVPLLLLVFWIGTVAYRQAHRGLWLAAGMVYGAAFYTYLAVRVTPLLLLGLFVYLWFWQPKQRLLLGKGVIWFIAGTGLVVAPLGWLMWQMPALFLSRANQVSIFQPEINGGDFWGTLLHQLGQTAGMFIWQGDSIIRHNPPGRPIFDPLMVVPFLLGLVWCLRHWRRPAAIALLLWVGVMLTPTLLAEDAPHFLRAVGVLPAAIFFPAIGLNELWKWEKMPALFRQLLVIGLIAGSLYLTIRDYSHYVQQPDTAYLFEQGARQLAESINQEDANTTIYLEQRLWDSWTSVPFLVNPTQNVHRFTVEAGLPAQANSPASLYLWPHQSQEITQTFFAAPALISAQTGSWGRGDLEAAPYPLYIRYHRQPLPNFQPIARFGEAIQLVRATSSNLANGQVSVDLYWATTQPISQTLVVLVHLMSAGNLIGQSDSQPADGHLPTTVWQPKFVIQDHHFITPNQPFTLEQLQILVGLYQAKDGQRVPAFTPNHIPVGDNWQISLNP